jgi:hypothetical protein
VKRAFSNELGDCFTFNNVDMTNQENAQIPAKVKNLS